MIIRDEFLKHLEIVGYDVLLIIENANVKFYSCEIMDSIPSVAIHAEPENPEFHCEGDLGEVAIRKGVNTFSVRVLHDKIVKMEYKLSIVLKKSASSAGLAGVDVNGDEAEPVMKNGEIEHYYYRVLSETGKVSIEAFPEKPDIKIEGDIGEQELEPGMNCFDIIAMSGDEKTRKNYQLLVEYQPLELFGVNDEQEYNHEQNLPKYQPLGLEFPIVDEILASEDVEENIVSDFETEIDTEPKREDDKEVPTLESVIIVGITDSSQLQEDNLLAIMATGGISENFFKDHMMKNEEILSLALIPEFEPETTEYLVRTEEEVSAIFIAAYPYDCMDLVTGDIGYQKLISGENHFTVLVMGAGGEQQYHINVDSQQEKKVCEFEIQKKEDIEEFPIRMEEYQAQEEPGLSYLTIEYGRLEPDFSSEIMDYTVISESNLTQMQISAIPNGDGCIVEGDLGEQEVLEGENIYEISAVLKNHSKQTIYRIHYTSFPEIEEVSLEDDGKNRSEPKKAKKRKKRKKRTWNLKWKVFKNKLSTKNRADKAAIRTTKLIHRLIVIFMFMCAASYLLNTFLLTPMRVTHESRQQTQNETAKTRQALEQYLKNRKGIEQTIAEYEVRLQEFGEAYPNVASQEEILTFLNDLSERIPFEYSIINIDVSSPVFTSDFSNEVMSKDMAAAVPDITMAIPPTKQQMTPSNAVAETQPDLKQMLQRNRATIAITSTYDIITQIYDAIINNERIVITDNIQLSVLDSENLGIENPEMENRQWQISLDLIFYSYTGAKEAS